LPIASDILENSIVIKKNGLIFENKNCNDLEKMLVFSVKNPEYSKKLGQEAKLDIQKNYSWDENVSRTLRLYEELLAEKNTGFLGFQIKRLS
jgi:glycosyltransferase involved in cell wall biosynthesis